MADISQHGNLKSYLTHALDETSYLKALVKQLGTITKDVDPEQGYASTLLNLNKRMLMSEKLLAKEVGIKALKGSPSGSSSSSEAQDVKSASMGVQLPVIACYDLRQRTRNFL